MASTIKNYDELPVFLKADDIARVLGVSRATAFCLVKTAGFPALRIGEKRIVIPKDKFLDWIEKQSDVTLGSYSTR